MTGRKRKATADTPAPEAPEVRQTEGRPAADRPRPAEPFEECGPTGGYGGAGTEDGGKDDE